MKKTKLAQLIYTSLIVPVVHSLDKRMKRIVAIGSLVGLLSDNSQRDKDLEVRLSKVMDLAVNSNSLTLPIVYHNWFWYQEPTENIQVKAIKQRLANNELCSITEDEVNIYSSFLISVMPSYLFYDTIENIKRDIKHLFESIPYIFTPQN